MAASPGVAVALVAGGVVGLWLGALWFVRGATRVARRLGVPGLVIGLTVVAFGTSAPEFAVTVDAALTGKGDISVGNVVGSNVVNLGFILGGTALVRSLPVSPTLVRRDSVVMLGTVVLVGVVVRDLTVSRVEGAVLCVLLVAYLAVLARNRDDRVRPGDEGSFGVPDVGRLVGGLALVVVAAHALVTGAVTLATAAGVSEWVVGLTVVAAGTSAPEFATSMAALYRGRTNLAAGNVLGSCIFNALGVLGVASLLRPIPVAGAAPGSVVGLFAIAAVATVLCWSRHLLTRPEGAVLVALAAVDWLADFLR
jgi:cation:H+ antiporter